MYDKKDRYEGGSADMAKGTKYDQQFNLNFAKKLH